MDLEFFQTNFKGNSTEKLCIWITTTPCLSIYQPTKCLWYESTPGLCFWLLLQISWHLKENLYQKLVKASVSLSLHFVIYFVIFAFCYLLLSQPEYQRAAELPTSATAMKWLKEGWSSAATAGKLLSPGWYTHTMRNSASGLLSQHIPGKMPVPESLPAKCQTESLFTGPKHCFVLQISKTRSITIWNNPVWSRKAARKEVCIASHLRLLWAISLAHITPEEPPQPHFPPTDLTTLTIPSLEDSGTKTLQFRSGLMVPSWCLEFCSTSKPCEAPGEKITLSSSQILWLSRWKRFPILYFKPTWSSLQNTAILKSNFNFI